MGGNGLGVEGGDGLGGGGVGGEREGEGGAGGEGLGGFGGEGLGLGGCGLGGDGLWNKWVMWAKIVKNARFEHWDFHWELEARVVVQAL